MMRFPPEEAGRTHVDGLTISTVNSSDMGWETAILDANNAHPVERYPDKESALRGHKKWVKRAATLTEVERIWYPGIPKEIVKLKRGYKE